MKNKAKIAIAAVFLTLCVSHSGVWANPTIKNVQSGVKLFSEGLAESLPFNATLGLNWSDAYIGKLVPSSPPHFGVGGSFGITTTELPMVEELAGYLGYDLSLDMDKMILPGYAAEARIGGFFLPFDIGVKFGYLPSVELFSSGVDADYLMVGGDLRYALLDGKSNGALPSVSLGFGLNYMKGGISGNVGSSHRIDYDLTPYGGGPHYITLEQPGMELKWDTFSLDFKAQISKSFFIITPYLGLGGSYGWSSAGYSISSKVTHDGATVGLTPKDIEEIKGYLRYAGLEDMDINSSGISATIKNSAFSFRAFGGFSIDLAVFRIDLTGLYAFRDNNYGASIGLRFQL